MRVMLKTAIHLCAHHHGLISHLPEDWIEDSEITLYFNDSDTAKLKLYLSRSSSIAILACKLSNEAEKRSASSKDILSFYLNSLLGIQKTSQLALATAFAEKVDGFRSVIYIGYGLGGNLAQLFAYNDMTHAISLESAGNKTLLEKAFEKEHISGVLNTRVKAFLHCILTFPNTINTHDQQIGDIYRLKLSHVKQTSWQHIALSAGDLLSVISLLTGIYFMLKASKPISWYTQLKSLIESAITSGLLYHPYGDASTSSLSDPEFIREYKLKFEALLSTIFKKTVSELFEEARPISIHGEARGQGYVVRYYNDTTKLRGATLEEVNRRLEPMAFKEIRKKLQEVIESAAPYLAFPVIFKLKNLLYGLPADTQHSLIKILSLSLESDPPLVSMSSWPETLKPVHYNYRHFFTNLFIPLRGWFIRDENAYRESQIRLIPGYAESKNTIDFEFHASTRPSIYTRTDPSTGSRLTITRIDEYDASNSNLNAKSLGSFALNSLFSTLVKLDLTNNYLDDEAAKLLPILFNQLTHLNLSRNRFTALGLLLLLQALRSADHCIQDLDLSENHISFAGKIDDQLSEITAIPTEIRLKLAGNFLELQPEFGIDLSHVETATRKISNRMLVAYLKTKIALFSLSNTTFSSSIPNCPYKVSSEQTLIHVVTKIDKSDIRNQHVCLLIEQVNPDLTHLKELITYELVKEIRETTNKGKALVHYSRLNLAKDRFRNGLLEGSVFVKSYAFPSEIINSTLIPKLNHDVKSGYLGDYDKFGFEGLNCAKWLVDRLQVVGLKINLSGLHLPIDIVGYRRWLSRASDFSG